MENIDKTIDSGNENIDNEIIKSCGNLIKSYGKIIKTHNEYKVILDKDQHIYYYSDNNNEIPESMDSTKYSVTSIINGDNSQYMDTNPKIKAASHYGIAVHTIIEKFIGGSMSGGTKGSLHDLFKNYIMDIANSEDDDITICHRQSATALIEQIDKIITIHQNKTSPQYYKYYTISCGIPKISSIEYHNNWLYFGGSIDVLISLRKTEKSRKTSKIVIELKTTSSSNVDKHQQQLSVYMIQHKAKYGYVIYDNRSIPMLYLNHSKNAFAFFISKFIQNVQNKLSLRTNLPREYSEAMTNTLEEISKYEHKVKILKQKRDELLKISVPNIDDVMVINFDNQWICTKKQIIRDYCVDKQKIMLNHKRLYDKFFKTKKVVTFSFRRFKNADL